MVSTFSKMTLSQLQEETVKINNGPNIFILKKVSNFQVYLS